MLQVKILTTSFLEEKSNVEVEVFLGGGGSTKSSLVLQCVYV